MTSVVPSTAAGFPTPSDVAVTTGAEAPQNRTEVAYQTLRTAILALRMPPGLSFSETALSTQLGISKTPVREALVRLKWEGLVDVQSRSGYTVAPVTIRDARDTCQLSALLDGESARLAAGASREEIEVVLANLAVLDNIALTGLSPQGDPDETAESVFRNWLHADVALHYELALLSGNHRFANTLRQTLEHQTRLYHLRLTIRPRTSDLFHRHDDLMTAIRHGDEEDSRQRALLLRNGVENTLLTGVMESVGVQYANAAPEPPKNKFYLDI